MLSPESVYSCAPSVRAYTLQDLCTTGPEIGAPKRLRVSSLSSHAGWVGAQPGAPNVSIEQALREGLAWLLESQWKYPCHENVFCVIASSGTLTTSETSVTGYGWQWEAVLDEWLLWSNVARFMFVPILSLSHSSKWVDMCSMIHAYYARILECWAAVEPTRFSWNEGQNANHSQQSGKAVFTEKEVKLPLILKFSSKKWHCIEALHSNRTQITFKIIPNSLLNASD